MLGCTESLFKTKYWASGTVPQRYEEGWSSPNRESVRVQYSTKYWLIRGSRCRQASINTCNHSRNGADVLRAETTRRAIQFKWLICNMNYFVALLNFNNNCKSRSSDLLNIMAADFTKLSFKQETRILNTFFLFLN